MWTWNSFVCAHVYVWMHVCGGQKPTPGILLDHSLPYFIVWVSHWTWTELSDVTRLARRQAPEILSPPSQSLDYRYLPKYLYFHMDIKDQNSHPNVCTQAFYWLSDLPNCFLFILSTTNSISNELYSNLGLCVRFVLFWNSLSLYCSGWLRTNSLYTRLVLNSQTSAFFFPKC